MLYIHLKNITQFIFKPFLSFLFIFCFTSVCCAKSDAEKVAHIYIDLASTPSLMQMIDAVQHPKEDPKLFIWKRFKALPANDKTLTDLNAQMVNFDSVGERDYVQFSKLVDENVSSFYKKNPDYSFIIHYNAVHIEKSGHIFNIIPIEKIKEVHLYEDALGQTLWYPHLLHWAMDFMYRVPTFVHVGFKNIDNLSDIAEEQIMTFNFQQAAEKLSEEQKATISKLTGLDSSFMKKAYKKRPVAVFLDDPFLSEETITAFLKELNKNPEVKNYTWIYKNHPRIKEATQNLAILKKNFSNVVELPNQIPLETLIVTGFCPDYIAGYGSSVFYSFSSKQILGYIERIRREDYIGPLTRLGILKPELIFRTKTTYNF